MADEIGAADDVQGGLTDAEKRENVIRCAFGGDPTRFDAFVQAVRDVVPPGTTVVLRGSAVTGRRWNDGAPFDADGPGTSDLDLTLVGADVIGLFSLTGFFVPGIHSRPLSDEDPDIAPSLVPLRAELMAMVGRPVNIQASRDIVIAFRGDLLDQPYLTLLEKPDTLTLLDRRGRDVTLRLLSYNIRHGGVGRVEAIAAVIRGCAPDVVVLQEATRPDVVGRSPARPACRSTGRTGASRSASCRASRSRSRRGGGRSCRGTPSST